METENSNFLFVWIMLTFLCGAICTDDIQLLQDKYGVLENGMEILSKRFDDFENRISTDKADVLNKQEQKILNIKSELKTYIGHHVKQAVSDVIRGETFANILKSQVVVEFKHLKRVNHLMKRQLHDMQMSLAGVVDDNRLYRSILQQGNIDRSDSLTCSKYFVKSELLTIELADRDRQLRDLKQMISERNDSSPNEAINRDIHSLLKSSKCQQSEQIEHEFAKCNHEISKLNRTLMEQCEPCKPCKTTSDKDTKIMLQTTQPSPNFSLTTPSNPTTNLSQTTSDPRTKKSRILVVPYSSSQHLQPRQVDINTNSIGTYPYLNFTYYESVVYISHIDSLLIGLYNPSKIICSNLNTAKIDTIRPNVRARGMAVDEERGIVFLVNLRSDITVVRMSLEGKNFSSVVSLADYGNNPRSIAVNPKSKTIYASSFDKLFTVGYDGSGLTTLSTGRYMNGLTFDITHSLLYYSEEKKLMRYSVSTNTSSQVTEFTFTIWNLVFYNDNVYYISSSLSDTTLGAVNVAHNTKTCKLQTVNVPSVYTFNMCLIP